MVDACLSFEDMTRQSFAMVPRWRIFGDFLGPAFPASHVQHTSDMHSKFAVSLSHVMYGSMVDIQSATAELRRGRKKRRKNKEQTTGRKYNVRICYAGRP